MKKLLRRFRGNIGEQEIFCGANYYENQVDWVLSVILFMDWKLWSVNSSWNFWKLNANVRLLNEGGFLSRIVERVGVYTIDLSSRRMNAGTRVARTPFI